MENKTKQSIKEMALTIILSTGFASALKDADELIKEAKKIESYLTE